MPNEPHPRNDEDKPKQPSTTFVGKIRGFGYTLKAVGEGPSGAVAVGTSSSLTTIIAAWVLGGSFGDVMPYLVFYFLITLSVRYGWLQDLIAGDSDNRNHTLAFTS